MFALHVHVHVCACAPAGPGQGAGAAPGAAQQWEEGLAGHLLPGEGERGGASGALCKCLLA